METKTPRKQQGRKILWNRRNWMATRGKTDHQKVE